MNYPALTDKFSGVEKMNLYERILISNVFIGLTTVPIYIILKSFPFFVVFGAGILTTLSVLILFFYFLGAKFVGTWAILQKFAVTLPTSFVLSHLVKLLSTNLLLEYIILFVVGYSISTPLIFFTYYVTRRIIKNGGSKGVENLAPSRGGVKIFNSNVSFLSVALTKVFSPLNPFLYLNITRYTELYSVILEYNAVY